VECADDKLTELASEGRPVGFMVVNCSFIICVCVCAILCILNSATLETL